MLTYTNHLKKLIIPEYGRNIQNMVDYCVTIPDREERQQCAQTIIDSMQIIVPPTGDINEYRRKLWDHLWIMSDCTLDIDYPFEHVDVEAFADRPDSLPLQQPNDMKYRHYGILIPRLIDKAVAMEPGEERDALVCLIANQMKKTLLANYNEIIEDDRIFNEIRYLSHGEIVINPDTLRLNDYRQAPTPSGKKKKKK